MTFEDLKKLQLGDEVWLIESKPLLRRMEVVHQLVKTL